MPPLGAKYQYECGMENVIQIPITSNNQEQEQLCDSFAGFSFSFDCKDTEIFTMHFVVL